MEDDMDCVDSLADGPGKLPPAAVLAKQQAEHHWRAQEQRQAEVHLRGQAITAALQMAALKQDASNVLEDAQRVLDFLKG